MTRHLVFILILTRLMISCDETERLKLVKVNGKDGKIYNSFYLNTENKKDSLEKFFANGVMSKALYWNEGNIDSIINYSLDGDILKNDITKDSIVYSYDENKRLIQKSTVNFSGNYEGISINYEDSLITNIANYSNGRINGLTINFDKHEYPILIGNIIDDSFSFGIQLDNEGKINALRVNDNSSRLGLIYRYYPSKKVKSKVELLDGKPHGYKIEYEKDGTIKAMRKYHKGALIRK
ncbi:hypothetical protein OOZ15_19620 [Galbibacter sp. EGI 63066]|uniref:hypothetical protein n=1 Tax=Galbibacter sp. EGI 63066 TaxID=2993559 RepID=UPI0022489B2D|nr:hypothetical protein [Galbibacter sp. EGI 63066]MCX2682160.1 hypothetical protein [Galbibacter sp. EGI 63066]